MSGSLLGNLPVYNVPPRAPDRTPLDTTSLTCGFGNVLTPIGMVITSVLGAVVTRVDGQTIGAGDLTASVSASPDVTGLLVYVSLSGGIADVEYAIAVGIQRTDGEQLWRSVIQFVTTPIG